MLKKKIIATGLAMMMVATTMVQTNVFANTDVYTIKEFEKNSNSVSFAGNEYSLFDTYTEPQLAYNYYSSKYENEIAILKEKYSLPDLSVSTATIYKQGFLLEYADHFSDINELICFLDIYENEEENSEIKRELQNYQNLVDVRDYSLEDAIQSAELLLPTKAENGNDKPIYFLRNAGFNLSEAKKYAKKWATEINPTYGEEKAKIFFSADCTNFVSQILYAGGISMDKYNDDTKGWWWSSKGVRSVSWVNANTFKNYMGSGYNTQKWSDFVSNVRGGDFIGVDFGDDGSVDHMGFVYTKSRGRLKIAQHTKNYFDWDGRWPDYDGKGRYYRVRR